MKENENLKDQAIKAQQEQQRQQQQAADTRAREEKTRQEDERRREEERRKTIQQTQKPFDQVEAHYRYVINDLKRENERFDASRRSDPAKQEQNQEKVQAKESPAMQRYKAHEKAMEPKVEEYIRQSQSRAKGQEKAPGRDR